MTATVELKAAEVRALVEELTGYERRIAAARTDEDRAKWEDRVTQVREQLAARGAAAEAPVRRASRRQGPTVAEER